MEGERLEQQRRDLLKTNACALAKNKGNGRSGVTKRLCAADGELQQLIIYSQPPFSSLLWTNSPLHNDTLLLSLLLAIDYIIIFNNFMDCKKYNTHNYICNIFHFITNRVKRQ